MRVHLKVLAAFVLVLGIALAGCLGGEEDLDSEDSPEVEAKDRLQSRVSMDQPADTWFEPGQTVEVSAQEPEGAVGNVSYTWVIQSDPFTVLANADQIDTGNITPGESADLTFDEVGFYEFGHCDPHPGMQHSVAVLDGYESPDEVTVYIYEEDLADEESWGFYPEHITIGTGTTVTYENLGAVAHTASIAHEDEAIPVPEPLGLTEREGTVTLDGFGWMNLIVLMEDEEGNGGWAKQKVYIRDRFADYEDTTDGSFPTGLEDEETETHKFDWSGTVTLNVSMPNDPLEAVQQIDVELYELDGEGSRLSPVIAENGTGPGQLEGVVSLDKTTEFELVVRPAQGVLIDYEIDIRVEYDHTPPELTQLPCPEPHYSLGHC